MIDIYIYENDTALLSLFSQAIENFILIDELDMNLRLATNHPSDILDKASSSKNTCLFFLNIDLNIDMNGLILAQTIRKLQPLCFIVFITSHSEKIFMTFQYKIEALDFIIKDTYDKMRSKIHECLLDVVDKYAAANSYLLKTFVIPLDQRRIIINYNDILFFKTSKYFHKIILYAKTRTIEFPAQLKEVELQLEEPFFRCHRSYLINTTQISEVDFQTGMITMTDGQLCPISSRLKNVLKKKLEKSK